MHTRTTPLPPVELADPIWTIEHVALAFRIGIRATRSLIATPNFPTAFRASSAPKARLYWRREQVLDFVAADAASGWVAATGPTPAAVTRHPTPTAATDVPRYVASDDDAVAAIAALRATQAVAA